MSGQAQEEQSLTEVWKSGIIQITKFIDKDKGEKSNAGQDDNPFGYAFISYTLVYIIVLGVCFAAAQILYSIIRDCFTRKNAGGIIDEYSGSIGILAVGISILWSIRSGALKDGKLSTIIAEFGKSFLAVMFIVALGILALEIIRLLMDMKEKLIRIEARYLFTSLVGLASILMLSMLNSIYGAVCAVIGFDADASLDNIQDRIKGKMIEEMERQLDEKKDYKMTFSGFSEKITKK